MVPVQKGPDLGRRDEGRPRVSTERQLAHRVGGRQLRPGQSVELVLRVWVRGRAKKQTLDSHRLGFDFFVSVALSLVLIRFKLLRHS